MKKCKQKAIRLILLAVIVSFIFCNMTVFATETTALRPLDGKTISILGDSISTFENVSSGDASLTSNSTIKNNHLYFTDGRLGITLNDTWWKQIIDKLGGEILVNNSYSNSMVYDPMKNAPSQAYLDRCINLHDNTGENSGEEPDIIFVYIGINDFSYHKTKLGTYSGTDFNSLIKEGPNKTTYAEPTTTCEAYAIMLHKIKTRYPDSEIYCFNFPAKKNLSDSDFKIFLNYNKDIEKIANHMKCNLVNLFSDTGIVTDSEKNSLYLADGVHPNKNGMDAITNAFLTTFYNHSRYIDKETVKYNVEYNVESNIIIDQGKLFTVKDGDCFYCSFTLIGGGPIDITVLMNDINVTNKYVKTSEIFIPHVNGNISIAVSSTAQSDSKSYKFVTKNNSICNVIDKENAENAIVPLRGIIENNVVREGIFVLSETICLRADDNWNLVWRASYSPSETPACIGFYNYKSNIKESNCFIQFNTQTNRLSLSEYSCGNYYDCGVDLNKYSIDFSAVHTYRLANIIDKTGINEIYLYVDGEKIAPLTNHYINDIPQNNASTRFINKDFYINNIGSTEVPVNNCAIEYIRVWESDVPECHIHDMAYAVTYEPTCTQDSMIRTYCDCGYYSEEIIEKAKGHSKTDWLTAKIATVDNSGLMYKKCIVCSKWVDTKVLPQLKPETPKLYGISNKINGVKIGWYAVKGADAYRIYRRGAGQQYWTYLATVTDTTYIDTTAPNNAYWRYTVRAVNEAGYSGYDSQGKYIKYVSAPSVQKLTNETTGICISWNKIIGATGYRVYRRSAGQTAWTYLGTTKNLQYVDKSVMNSNGKYYRYTIRAVNGYYSDFDTNGLYIKRLVNPVLKSATSSKTGVIIKWGMVEGATGYYIYRKTSNSTWTRIATVKGINNISFTDKTAKKGTTYTYTVKAYCGKYTSSYNYKGISCKDKY